MKVKTSYNECEYIASGKVYELTIDGPSESIIDDRGELIEIVLPRWGFGCSHLDNIGEWEVVE